MNGFAGFVTQAGQGRAGNLANIDLCQRGVGEANQAGTKAIALVAGSYDKAFGLERRQDFDKESGG